MFITIRDTDDNLILLNVNHIISVEPYRIKSPKIGENDTIATKITSLGAMVSTTIVYDSVEEISRLINEALTTK